jgi:hypothetical protein
VLMLAFPSLSPKYVVKNLLTASLTVARTSKTCAVEKPDVLRDPWDEGVPSPGGEGTGAHMVVWSYQEELKAALSKYRQGSC